MMVKKIVLVGGVAFLLLLIIFVYYFQGQSSLSNSAVLMNCRDLNRSDYGLSPLVFAQLPPSPACFGGVVEKYHQQLFSNSLFFSREYFLQPEFYPNFLEQGLSFWQNPDENRYGVIGFGAFPAEQTVVLSPGEVKTVRVFLHAGFGVRSFQGMRLRASLRNPSESVSVALDSASERGFLLSPTFPVFTDAWARAVDAEIVVAPGASSEVVEINLVSTPPSSEDSVAWSHENARYYAATQYVGPQVVARVLVKIVQPRTS